MPRIHEECRRLLYPNDQKEEQADSLLAQQPVTSRTLAMVLANPKVALCDGDKNSDRVAEIIIRGVSYPCVTRYTRNFNCKMYTAGSSSEQENIFLDPTSATLAEAYDALKEKVEEAKTGETLSTLALLNIIKEFTRKCLPNANVETIPRDSDGVIPLERFLNEGIGVCRHHALLNCYLMSRLQKDGLLKGEIIHHRQNVLEMRGAHAWVILKTESGYYSLDSANNNVHHIDNDKFYLDRKWGVGTVEKIKKRYAKDPAIEFIQHVLPDEHLNPHKKVAIAALKARAAKNEKNLQTALDKYHSLSAFYDSLEEIGAYAIELSDNDHMLAARAATVLVENLNKEAKNYLENSEDNAYQTFKIGCFSEVEKAKPDLQIHRGCKRLLERVIEIVLTCIPVLIEYTSKFKAGKNFLLFGKKACDEKLDRVTSAVSNAEISSNSNRNVVLI